MRHPIALWFAATRPAFLSVTVVGVLLGLACAEYDNTFRSLPLALLTLAFALIAHAGANVINDYYDALNGCDEANTARIAPFTGGSRFIQNGLLTRQQTCRYGYSLLALVIPAGLWLLAQSGSGLLWIGLAGMISGWAYSAPPLRLQSRGLGEIAITLAWAMVVIGSTYVQAQFVSTTSLFAALAYAPLVANVLFVNQIPDRHADAHAGKRTLIVRHSPTIAFAGSLLLDLVAIVTLGLGISQGALPVSCWVALVAAIPAYRSLCALYLGPTDPVKLRIAIPATIQSGILFGAGLTLGLIL